MQSITNIVKQIKYILSIVLSLFFISCGYTILKDLKRDDNPPGSFQDLSLVTINGSISNIIIADDRNPNPSYSFTVKLTNIGTGTYIGPLIIAWADNLSDIENHKYPNSESFSRFDSKISPKDTISFGILARHKNYQPGTSIRIIIITRNVMPAEYSWTIYHYLPDNVESRYDNNILDYQTHSMLCLNESLNCWRFDQYLNCWESKKWWWHFSELPFDCFNKTLKTGGVQF